MIANEPLTQPEQDLLRFVDYNARRFPNGVPIDATGFAALRLADRGLLILNTDNDTAMPTEAAHRECFPAIDSVDDDGAVTTLCHRHGSPE